MWMAPDRACIPSLVRTLYLGEMPELSTFLLFGEEDNLHINCGLTMIRPDTEGEWFGFIVGNFVDLEENKT